MNRGIYEILENKALTKDIWKMVLSGETSHITAPGQFINIQLDGFYLRRPISICDFDDKTVTGVTYRYAIRAVDNKIKSGYVATDGMIFLEQPTLTISNG